MGQLSLLLDGIPEVPVDFYPDFLSSTEADWLLAQSKSISWKQNTFPMFGKETLLPRLESIFGDPRCTYIYSGSVILEPEPWTEALLWLRERVEAATGHQYHIVIGNQYRNGKDSIGWHSDDEKSMGDRPAIASISLGATRRFSLKAKNGGKPTHYDLHHGSLLFMQPGCQEDFLHCVAKTEGNVGMRINWTFRPHVNSMSHGK